MQYERMSKEIFLYQTIFFRAREEQRRRKEKKILNHRMNFI